MLSRAVGGRVEGGGGGVNVREWGKGWREGGRNTVA